MAKENEKIEKSKHLDKLVVPEKIDLGKVIKNIEDIDQPRELFNSIEKKINALIDFNKQLLISLKKK